MEGSTMSHILGKEESTSFEGTTGLGATVRARHGVPADESSSSSALFDDNGLTYPETASFKKKAWLVVFGSFMGLLPSWGVINAGGVIQTHLMENELSNYSMTQVSWLFATYECLSLVSSIFSGSYFDRNGARVPMVVGTIMFCGGFLGMASSTKLWQFILSFSFCCGIGTGILMSPIMGVIAHYFPKKSRATPLACATEGGCFGGFLFPYMLRKSYTTVGYAWSMRIVAIVSFLCLCVSCVLVKERSFAERKPMSRTELVHYYLTDSFDLKALIYDYNYLFNVIGCVFTESSVMTSTTYFTLICTKSGFSEGDSYIFFSIIYAMSIPCRFIAGRLADKKVGSYNMIIISLVLCGVANLVIWAPFQTSRAAMYIYCVVYGIVFAGAMSLIPGCCSQIIKAENFGARYATMYSITGFVMLATLPGGSAIIGPGTDFGRNIAFIAYAAALGFVAAAAYMVTRVRMVGWKKCKF